MWYKNIAGSFFGLVTLVTKHTCDGQNYDSQDRASIAASRGKNEYPPDALSNLLLRWERQCGGCKTVIGLLSVPTDR